ncbi:hypothetical protein CHU95_20045 [Niveispirillum lacus]|uniref:DUF2793 domain-containing protein n=1 Tax=Niveispirillum lacus TaxID=1981099 RepID=A0A255YS23_9PROT|nr:hypothetical protein [Niveispirillum lacus]OYQ31445.1 hypothetical protein CHU95_20045 [Niveispirillum lacus]
MSQKISEMTAGSAIGGKEMLPAVQGGANVRTNPDAVLAAFKVLRPVARVAFLQFEEPGVGALPPATTGDRYAVGFVGSPAGSWGSIAGVAAGDIIQYNGSAWVIDWDASAAVAGGAGFLVQVATGANLTGGGWHGFIGGSWQALVQAPAVYSVNATGSNASGAAFHGSNGLPSSVVVNSTASGQGVRASSAVGPTTYLNTSGNQVELYPASNSDQFHGLSQGQAVPLSAGGWRTIMTVYRQDIGRNIHVTLAQSA